MNPINVLLVEDQEIDARGMKRYIKQAGAKLEKHCHSKQEFDDYWPQSTANIIILDLELGRKDPQRSGWEIANFVATSDRPIPIIIWSNFNDKDTWRRIHNHDNLVGLLNKDGSYGQFIGMLYSSIIKCYPDAEDTFLLPEGYSAPGTDVAPRSGVFTVKAYGTTDHYVIHPTFIRYVETNGSSRVKIHHKADIIECSNSLVGVIDYANTPGLVQISRFAVINTKYAYKLKSTDCVYVQSINGRKQLPIGDEFRKNMKSWWGKLKSPKKK